MAALVLATILLLLVTSRGAQGLYTWTTSGPEGGLINALAADDRVPGVLYAGANRGAFKSSTGGTFWSPLTALASSQVLALAIHPDSAVLYAGTNSGVFKSTDGGGSFSVSFAGSGATALVTALAIDPGAPSTIYAGTLGGGGVLKSTDDGASWSPISDGLPSGEPFLTAPGISSIRTLVVDPSTMTTVYAGTQGTGLFKSTNGGGSWNDANSGLIDSSASRFDITITSFAIDPTTTTTAYAGTDAGVFKSLDAGGSWFASNSGLTNTSVIALTMHPRAPSVLYVGTNGGGVFRSSDGGTIWAASNSGLTSYPENTIHALAIAPETSSTVHAGTLGAGVVTSTNGGADWGPSNNSLRGSVVLALAIDPDLSRTLYAGTVHGRIFRDDGPGHMEPEQQRPEQ